MKKSSIILLILTALSYACTTDKPKQIKTLGSFERIDPALDSIISSDAKAEVIADASYDWTEGPLWVDAKQMLLFSDVPKNIVYKWFELVDGQPKVRYSNKPPASGSYEIVR